MTTATPRTSPYKRNIFLYESHNDPSNVFGVSIALKTSFSKSSDRYKKITFRCRHISRCCFAEDSKLCGISLRVFECSERVRYRDEHEKRNSISTSNHLLFCLLYKHFRKIRKKKATLLTNNKQIRTLRE